MTVTPQAIALWAALAFTAPPVAALAAESDNDLLDFVVGDYAVIGRDPDGGATYAGTARIARRGDDLTFERQRGDRKVTAAGRLEVPSPPGEGHVLRFRWRDPDPVTMTCLIGTDLDNYARLTCYWMHDGTEPRQPGLEAMFATADWPDAAAKP